MKVSMEQIQALAAERIGLRPRLGYTALLLVGLGGAGVTGSLLLTEPSLPLRTRMAFAILTIMSLSWAALAGWVLTRRRVLLARHSVVAARMAVAFSTIMVAGALAAGYSGAGTSMYGAAAVGVVMLVVAIVLLARAGKRLERLVERCRALERAAGGPVPRPPGQRA